MDAPELSVYGEAKGEYTRQLCVFLVPSLESYFLNLLETAKEEAPSPSKALWQFQSLLQAIPDWNQDKVIRETEAIQKDTKCDYLEELLTAVFIAHTKVLSAIRLTTKQKKLQITIPKLDHFLHRVLSEGARCLWSNAYLFADGNHIERQKNLRQVASLLQESVLQAIRGLLPVKSILREYLHEDDEEENKAVEPAPPASHAPEPSEEDSTTTEAAPVQEVPAVVEEVVEAVEEAAAPVAEESVAEAPKEDAPVQEAPAQEAPATIVIDTKSVSFSNEHVMFDSDSLNENTIAEAPFAEAENRPPEEDWEDEDEDCLKIEDEVLPIDAGDMNLD